MHNRSMGAALVCLAIATSPAAIAAGKKDRPKKAAEPAPVVTDVAPPSGAWEAAPKPNNDYVWSKGYYDWKDGRYQWTNGEWVLKKEGMAYQQHQWVKRADGKYELTGGKWVPDEQAAKAGDEKAGTEAKGGTDAKRMGASPAAKR